MIVERTHDLARLQALIEQFPVTAIIGARQVGKTTIAQELGERLGWKATRFDLEDPEDYERMRDTMFALRDVRGLVVIDEVQRTPEVFPTLRVLADRHEAHTRYLVLGSASPALLRQSSESLAGRIVYHELGGFTLRDVGPEALRRLWSRGGFPRSFLASGTAASSEWRKSFLRTFLERDIPQLGISIPSVTLRRFWKMLAHYHGQLWNASEFGRSFGLSDATMRKYLDILTAALVVRQLAPWHENLGKRQVKAPKIYIADTGLLHTLLDIDVDEALENHPKVGASWEGFIIDQVIRLSGLEWSDCHFWRTHAGAELDLFFIRNARRIGVEVKHGTTPTVTPSMRSALADLKLDQLIIVHSGSRSFPIAERILAVSSARMLEDFPSL